MNLSTPVPGSTAREKERLQPALAASPQADSSRDEPSKQSLSAEPARSKDMIPAEVGISVETPSSLEMHFPSFASDNVTGESNFDLNMVDLLDGANFDSLFDLIGQQGSRHSHSAFSGSGHHHHGDRGHRAHRAHPHNHRAHYDQFDQFDHRNQVDNDDPFDFFDQNDNRDHQDQQDQQDQRDYHEYLQDADFGQSEELKYVNVTYNRDNADLSAWELFEIAKEAIQNGRATVTENPVMNVRRLVWSIKVEGRFPTEAHVLNEAYAISSRMQVDTEFERGYDTEICALFDRVTDGFESPMQ
ncbi:uncharacterized protein PFLUO_LOCUS4540 [Penicillium psychrofluorescens]|uniref:uncharacterized protein n=1 Tax=Penicillium psychrofluorescens TaxID=3158075 RepID=UPI003CCCC038